MKRRCTVDEKKNINNSGNGLGKSAKAFIIKHKGVYSPETRSRGTSSAGLQTQELNLFSPEKESPERNIMGVSSFLEDTLNSLNEEKGKEQLKESFNKIKISDDSRESKVKLINCSIFSRLHKSNTNKSTSPGSKEETMESSPSEDSMEIQENEKKSLFFQTKRKDASEKVLEVKIGEVIGEGKFLLLSRRELEINRIKSFLFLYYKFVINNFRCLWKSLQGFKY